MPRSIDSIRHSSTIELSILLHLLHHTSTETTKLSPKASSSSSTARKEATTQFPMISTSRFISIRLPIARSILSGNARVTAGTLIPIRRGYRGDAGDAVNKLTPAEEDLLKIALPKSEEIYRKHIELPVNDLATRQKRLIYRAKQRGWLEVGTVLIWIDI